MAKVEVHKKQTGQTKLMQYYTFTFCLIRQHKNETTAYAFGKLCTLVSQATFIDKSAKKHEVSRNSWVLASFKVLSKSVKWLQQRRKPESWGNTYATCSSFDSKV